MLAKAQPLQTTIAWLLNLYPWCLMSSGFRCSICGQLHDHLPFDYGIDAPEHYYSIPEAEREACCELTSDLCVIEERDFFIRGCIEIPVLDSDQRFVWGVWASLSLTSFERIAELWEAPGRESEPPFFGWLCTRLLPYPDTLLMKTLLHLRPIGQRPTIQLEPTDHPLAIEQRCGISLQRVQEIAELLLH